MKKKSWKTAIAAAAIMALPTACQQRQSTPIQPTSARNSTATYYCDRSADGTQPLSKLPEVRYH